MDRSMHQLLIESINQSICNQWLLAINLQLLTASPAASQHVANKQQISAGTEQTFSDWQWCRHLANTTKSVHCILHNLLRYKSANCHFMPYFRVVKNLTLWSTITTQICSTDLQSQSTAPQKFTKNLFMTFWVIQPTHRQTERQTDGQAGRQRC